MPRQDGPAGRVGRGDATQTDRGGGTCISERVSTEHGGRSQVADKAARVLDAAILTDPDALTYARYCGHAAGRDGANESSVAVNVHWSKSGTALQRIKATISITVQIQYVGDTISVGIRCAFFCIQYTVVVFI